MEHNANAQMAKVNLLEVVAQLVKSQTVNTAKMQYKTCAQSATITLSI